MYFYEKNNLNMIDINDCYWDRVHGYLSELRIDARWILRGNDDDKPYGSLRIVSHPDLKPGYLRSIFTYVTSIRNKTFDERLMAIEDYQMGVNELEVYSVDSDIKTDIKVFEAPFKELEQVFNVKIFS